MYVEFLKQIVGGISGQGSEKIVEIMCDKKDVNEFLIAKKLNLTINQTRNILYSLVDEGLVSFNRKKDKKKGGWYTYFWTLDTAKSLNRFKKILLSDIEKLNNSLNSRSTQRFFHCKNCEIEFSEENALMKDYTCPECGEILELKENGGEVEVISKELDRLSKIFNQVDEELENVNKKDEKSRQRRIKTQERKKAKEKSEKAEKRRAIKKAAKKEEDKKAPAKKTAKKAPAKKTAKKAPAKKTAKKAPAKKTAKKVPAKKTAKKAPAKKTAKKAPAKKTARSIFGKTFKKIVNSKK